MRALRSAVAGSLVLSVLLVGFAPVAEADTVTDDAVAWLVDQQKADGGFDVEQFVFSSTMLVHRPAEPGQLINEDWPIEPQYEFLADSVWGDFAYGRNAVYESVGRNEIPHRRIGKQIRFSRRGIMRWLDSWSSQGAKEGK